MAPLPHHTRGHLLSDPRHTFLHLPLRSPSNCLSCRGPRPSPNLHSILPLTCAFCPFPSSFCSAPTASAPLRPPIFHLAFSLRTIALLPHLLAFPSSPLSWEKSLTCPLPPYLSQLHCRPPLPPPQLAIRAASPLYAFYSVSFPEAPHLVGQTPASSPPPHPLPLDSTNDPPRSQSSPGARFCAQLPNRILGLAHPKSGAQSAGMRVVRIDIRDDVSGAGGEGSLGFGDEHDAAMGELPGRVTAWGWDAAGEAVALGTADGVIAMHRCARPESTKKSVAPEGRMVEALAWHPLGAVIVFALEGGMLALLDAALQPLMVVAGVAGLLTDTAVPVVDLASALGMQVLSPPRLLTLPTQSHSGSTCPFLQPTHLLHPFPARFCFP